MSLLDRIQKDLIEAMKAKEDLRLNTIRAIKAALLKYKADSMKDADAAAEMQLLKQLVKQRTDAMEQFRAAGRAELADKEEAELKIISTYLPQAATPEEMEKAVAEALAETGATGKAAMGAVMKAAQAKLAGKTVDGKALSSLVQSKLA